MNRRNILRTTDPRNELAAWIYASTAAHLGHRVVSVIRVSELRWVVYAEAGPAEDANAWIDLARERIDHDSHGWWLRRVQADRDADEEGDRS